MLGDVYLTLAWLAFQRLRQGPLWPWETRSRRPGAAVVTLLRPEEEEEAEETARRRSG